MKMDNAAIGRRIRKEREKMELSREEFAEIIGLSDYYVGQLERGERQMSLPASVKIASCLHVSLDYLILGKFNYNEAYIHDSSANTYETSNDKLHEINTLLEKCSPKETELLKKLIKTIMPYMGTNQ